MFVIIGVPCEVKNNEHRVELTPSRVIALWARVIKNCLKRRLKWKRFPLWWSWMITHEKIANTHNLTYQSLASVLDGKPVSTI